MKIKAIMLGLVVSGTLLFSNGMSLEKSKQEIDKIEVNPMNPEYIKFLAKKIVDLKEGVNLNTNAIISTAPVFKGQEMKIKLLQQQVDRMEALHDQLVDLVAKQR
ncbi:hypothetical protein ACQJ93_02300 [Helicobacter pylori]